MLHPGSKSDWLNWRVPQPLMFGPFPPFGMGIVDQVNRSYLARRTSRAISGESLFMARDRRQDHCASAPHTAEIVRGSACQSIRRRSSSVVAVVVECFLAVLVDDPSCRHRNPMTAVRAGHQFQTVDDHSGLKSDRNVYKDGLGRITEGSPPGDAPAHRPAPVEKV